MVEAAEGAFHSPTEYTLVVDINIGAMDRIIGVNLHFSSSDFTKDQARDIGGTFVHAMRAVVDAPTTLLDRHSRVFQWATHTFDMSLYETLVPLMQGGCVCIPSEHDRMNDLAGATNALRADWVIMTSTVADTLHPDDVPRFKTLVLGGEPLRTDIHARWAPRVNLFQRLRAGRGLGSACRTWVVDKDEDGKLAAVGSVGELLLERPILSRGYLNGDPSNAKAYVCRTLPWASAAIGGVSQAPTRLYKTEDLVRYTGDRDGALVYVGYKDTQVKIRGQRVELGEIKHLVGKDSALTQTCAVEKVLLGDDAKGATLAAFFVPTTFPSLFHGSGEKDEVLLLLPADSTWLAELDDVGENLRALISTLPAYMVPSLYVPIRRMPQTQTEKIDRKALRRIGATLSPDQIQFCSVKQVDDDDDKWPAVKRAPATEMKLLLQSLWAKLLGIQDLQHSISTHDNFFSKGGDSVNAMQLTALARSRGVRLIVADIIKNPRGETAPLGPFSLLPANSRTFVLHDAASQCSVAANAIQDMYPCTPLKEGLMELTTQREGAYIAQRVFRLGDHVDIGGKQFDRGARGTLLRPPAAPPPSPPGYNLFIKAIREHVNEEESKAFWSRLMRANPCPLLSFPPLRGHSTAYSSPSSTSGPDAQVTRTVRMRDDGYVQAGFTTTALLKATWAMVTAQHLGTTHIVFAATNSGKNAPVPGIERIVRPSIATVPVQLSIAWSSWTAWDLLTAVQQLSTDMIPFVHAGLQNIYDSIARGPLKQKNLNLLRNLFVVHRQQQQQQKYQQTTTSSAPAIMDELVDEKAIFAASTSLPESTAVAVLDQFEHLVQQLAIADFSPSSTRPLLLKDLDPFTASHRQQMVDWNCDAGFIDNIYRSIVVDNCVHNLFREQARITRPALRQVRCLARRERRRHDTWFAGSMCFETSIAAVVAMMGTLKASGCCVNLGRKTPVVRMREVLSQATSSIILTNLTHASKFEELLPCLEQTEILIIDQDYLDSLLAGPGTQTNISITISPNSPAFVLFTSGTTSQPKDVVLHHNLLCTSSRTHGTNRKVGPDTKLFEFAAYTFDVSISDIFTSLQRGGCVCIPSEEERINDVTGAIERMGCNYAYLTPTVAGMLDPAGVPGLHHCRRPSYLGENR
ncbi:hypothetical protein B0H66DRAFT_602500 [Apodospora peruviana]|uniref:Carrier domain-containing protein n=1 Tax=Apodospora peruviana TaxID=516989 RepID=A0AAE0M8D2_9PEZI|nr:hypothetical protein B0H66DRAFT_602500 [Apodospora peruviana]